MKIMDIKTFVVNGGYRPWIFVKVETDEGITGWGDACDWDAPEAVVKAVDYLKGYLVGDDPMAIEKIWFKNSQIYQRMAGGIAWKAMSGIDTALWDIKGKALNAPVWQLLGGRIHDRLRLYWSHCGSARFNFSQHIDKPRIRTLADLKEFAQEVKASGVTALKTNLIALEDTPYFGKLVEPVANGAISNEAVKTIELILGVFREALGPDIGIALDTAFNFRLGGAIRLARALEPFDMMWYETETLDPDSLLTVRRSTKTPIVHGESLYGLHGYKPYLELHAQDAVMIDLAWNGLTMGRKIADLALAYDTPVSPHNCHSPLQTFVSANFCASLPNFLIMEIDYEDVPWRDDLLTHPYEIKGGYLTIPGRPGLGTDLVEKELVRHAGWQPHH